MSLEYHHTQLSKGFQRNLLRAQLELTVTHQVKKMGSEGGSYFSASVADVATDVASEAAVAE